jgi:hypothetical protein
LQITISTDLKSAKKNWGGGGVIDYICIWVTINLQEMALPIENFFFTNRWATQAKGLAWSPLHIRQRQGQHTFSFHNPLLAMTTFFVFLQYFLSIFKVQNLQDI